MASTTDYYIDMTGEEPIRVERQFRPSRRFVPVQGPVIDLSMYDSDDEGVEIVRRDPLPTWFDEESDEEAPADMETEEATDSDPEPQECEPVVSTYALRDRRAIRGPREPRRPRMSPLAPNWAQSIYDQ